MTVTIDISVESEPSLLEVYWMFKPHENTTSIKQGKVGMEGGNVTVPSLTIVYPTKFHIGFYSLCAINLLGTRCSEQIQLIVIGGKRMVYMTHNLPLETIFTICVLSFRFIHLNCSI